MSEKRYKIHVDQDEVLEHLSKLGYKDVQPEMLKDFMKGILFFGLLKYINEYRPYPASDLKKLIKYDLVKNNGKLPKVPLNGRQFNNSVESASCSSNASTTFSSTASSSYSSSTKSFYHVVDAPQKPRQHKKYE
jgi:hypothetical protein